jgi:hypothetical protein
MWLALGGSLVALLLVGGFGLLSRNKFTENGELKKEVAQLKDQLVVANDQLQQAIAAPPNYADIGAMADFMSNTSDSDREALLSILERR